MNPKALTESQITEVRQRYTQGESTYDMAEEYYCCRQTIWEYVKDIKDRPKTSKRKTPEHIIKLIKSARKVGTRGVEIARMLDVSRMTVSKYGRAL
jgi:biotin operon repressor